MGRMEAFYGPKNPIMGAFYMAHFNDHVNPYFIERDLVVPPLELQRLISPWIEYSFDKDQPSHAHVWKLECDAKMQGVDANVPMDEDVHWNSSFEYTTATTKLMAKFTLTSLSAASWLIGFVFPSCWFECDV